MKLIKRIASWFKKVYIWIVEKVFKKTETNQPVIITGILEKKAQELGIKKSRNDIAELTLTDLVQNKIATFNDGVVEFSPMYGSIPNSLVFYYPKVSSEAKDIKVVDFAWIKSIKGAIDFGGCRNLEKIDFGRLESVGKYLLLPHHNVKIEKLSALKFSKILYLDEKGNLEECYGDTSD